MSLMSNLIRRFGGVNIPRELPDDANLLKMADKQAARLNARLQSIEVDLDVTARRQIPMPRKGVC